MNYKNAQSVLTLKPYLSSEGTICALIVGPTELNWSKKQTRKCSNTFVSSATKLQTGKRI